ncbi:hypothetical protein ACT3R7_06910 [Halomonas sp. AOP43-A1-21]
MTSYYFDNWSLPDGVLKKIKSLATDQRCKGLSIRLDESTLGLISDEFSRAIERDAWDQKTQAARDAWFLKFEKTLNQLIDLADEGPRSMDEWGFPIRDHVLMGAFNAIANKFEIDAPQSSDTIEYFKKMNLAQSATDELGWSLSDTLKHYLDQVKCDCTEPQILKKPADEKSARAWFIIYMNEHGMFTKVDIAVISSVLFDDEGIDDRLVRRLTSGR